LACVLSETRAGARFDMNLAAAVMSASKPTALQRAMVVYVTSQARKAGDPPVAHQFHDFNALSYIGLSDKSAVPITPSSTMR
jgi:hypothetical protein